MEMTHSGGTLGSAAADKGVVAAAGSGGMRLEELAIGATARVVSVSAAGSCGAADMARRLAELGFLPGEKLRIVARGLMGREPIAVRIGTGTFALRLFEAACIRVSPERSLLP
jgi:ferrous iron transport protein A